MSTLLTPEQAAELVPFSARWIREQLAAGRLRGSKISGRWMVEATAIAEMHEANTNIPTVSPRRRRQRLMSG